MVLKARLWLKERKFLLRIFSFLTVLIIALCLGSVTAFAEGESEETNAKGYAKLSPEPQDGESRWGWPLDGIYDSFREAAYNLIMDTLDGSFSLIDNVTDTANAELKKTPKEYQSTIFTTVDKVAKQVIMPIATVILTYVVLLEFMQNVMDKNNFHDFDTSVFIRWIIKTTVAILFLTNAVTIVGAFFDLGKTLADNLVTVTSSGDSTLAGIMDKIDGTLCQCGIGTFVSMLIPIGLLNIVSIAMYMMMYVIMIGRMIEIYLHISIAPIPLATITNREFGETGKNYLKIIFSFVLQMFFILLCICIYRALLVSVGGTIEGLNVATANISWTINSKLFEILAYGIVLILTMFKSQSLAKSILNAH